MTASSTTITLLSTPITLAELASHLTTRKNFLLHPCRERALRAIQIVAGPYGYDVEFDAANETVTLRYRHADKPSLSAPATVNLTATQQMKLSCRR